MRSGQALVLVMMVLSVALTVGLSIVARSTNEVKITSSQEESARALEAAEAGLEKALGGTLQGVSQATLNTSGATYVVAPTPVPGARLAEFVIPYQLVEGQVATVDLTNYDKPSAASEKDKIRFCWGTSASGNGPALEVSLYYAISGEDKIGKAIFDPVNRIPSSVSGPWPTASCPSGFKYSVKVPMSEFGVANVDLVQFKMMRLRPLFNGATATPLAVITNGGDFGRQGDDYTSVGSAGTSTQKIRGVELNYDLPGVFDNAVFSGTSLSK